jgi:hypothetical protein
MSKHTPEPWSKVDFQRFPFTDITQRGLQIEDFARSVACVNACAGMDDPAKYMEGVKILEKTYHDLQAEKAILRNERDELLKALGLILSKQNCTGMNKTERVQQMGDIAQRAIDKAKGGDS